MFAQPHIEILPPNLSVLHSLTGNHSAWPRLLKIMSFRISGNFQEIKIDDGNQRQPRLPVGLCGCQNMQHDISYKQLMRCNDTQRQFRSTSIIWRLLFCTRAFHHLSPWELIPLTVVETCVIKEGKRLILHAGKDSELTIPNDCAITLQKVNNISSQRDKQQQQKKDTRIWLGRCVSMSHIASRHSRWYMQITWIYIYNRVRLLRLYKPTATWRSNESKCLPCNK